MPAAQAELARIADYIALDNPLRAASFVHELVTRCLDLADQPKRFPVVEHYAGRQVRRRSYGAYLIFYRVTAQQVEVLHIFNGAQDYTALLEP